MRCVKSGSEGAIFGGFACAFTSTTKDGPPKPSPPFFAQIWPHQYQILSSGAPISDATEDLNLQRQFIGTGYHEAILVAVKVFMVDPPASGRSVLFLLVDKN